MRFFTQPPSISGWSTILLRVVPTRMNSSCSAIGFAWFYAADSSVGNRLNNRMQSYGIMLKTLIRKTKRNGAIVTDRRENAEKHIRKCAAKQKNKARRSIPLSLLRAVSVGTYPRSNTRTSVCQLTPTGLVFLFARTAFPAGYRAPLPHMGY